MCHGLFVSAPTGRVLLLTAGLARSTDSGPSLYVWIGFCSCVFGLPAAIAMSMEAWAIVSHSEMQGEAEAISLEDSCGKDFVK
jgi:hypothetical protein